MRSKLQRLETEAAQVGLKTNIKKTKETLIRMPNNDVLTLDNTSIENVEEFNYLGSIITNTGGIEVDVQNRIIKARRAFGILNPIWNFRTYSKTWRRISQNKVELEIKRRKLGWIGQTLRRPLAESWTEIKSVERNRVI